MDMVVSRFEVWLVSLDPAIGSEIQKTRPCLIVSPNEANRFLLTVTIVPLTSTLRNYPTRLNCIFKRKTGQLATDQIRSVDKSRLVKKSGVMDEATCRDICRILMETYKY